MSFEDSNWLFIYLPCWTGVVCYQKHCNNVKKLILKPQQKNCFWYFADSLLKIFILLHLYHLIAAYCLFLPLKKFCRAIFKKYECDVCHDRFVSGFKHRSLTPLSLMLLLTVPRGYSTTTHWLLFNWEIQSFLFVEEQMITIFYRDSLFASKSGRGAKPFKSEKRKTFRIFIS